MWHFLPIGGGSHYFDFGCRATSFHAHHLYHWMDTSLYHEYMIVEGDHTQYVDEMIGWRC